ncbi:hypothetical protein DPMN_081557 [Dreissena polymorpha]|uniref:Uncharacterized protein n=1 Tax=Dreissena polymorpha TaxID=45954 RepID=A0A9D4BHW4_DREPO|nr:hypothetical protein DPMN_081557 [Dreissena polymorpha]
MLMHNLGATQPIVEEDEEEYAAPSRIDKNESDEDKNKRMEGRRETWPCGFGVPLYVDRF